MTFSGGGLTVIESDLVATLLAASVTFTVNVEVPTAVVVPDSVPSVPSVIPFGSPLAGGDQV